MVRVQWRYEVVEGERVRVAQKACQMVDTEDFGGRDGDRVLGERAVGCDDDSGGRRGGGFGVREGETATHDIKMDSDPLHYE